VINAEELHERTRYDLAIRRAMFSDDPVIEVPAGTEGFWSWYADTVRFGEAYELRPVHGAPPYPAPSRPVALWFSGGAESTYTLHQIEHLEPDLLHIEDYAVFFGDDRKIGQIHFLCAAISAGLGYADTYLGVERDDLLLRRTRFAQRYVERHPSFLDRWSAYQPEHRLRTVCGQLDKEEVIAWLVAHDVPITGTCDRHDDGTWCGDCYKCFEAYYAAKAVGIDLGFRLTRRAFDEIHGTYRRYVDTEFADSFNNSYHRFARLQILYGVTFDAVDDCIQTT
jgi:hypothetical protein